MSGATLLIEHLDARGLEPPEPLERVIDALAVLPVESQLCLLIEREPHPLYRMLANNGYRHSTMLLPDFTYEIRIWRAALA